MALVPGPPFSQVPGVPSRQEIKPEFMETAKNRLEDSDLSELSRCRARVRNLKECFRVSGLINSTLELEEVLEHIMTASREVLGADACSLLLVDESTEELVFEVAQGPVAHKLKTGLRLKKGEGIAGHVFQTGEPLIIVDAYRDERFHPDFDRKTGYRTQSILCVPLKIKDRVIGVSQVINKVDGTAFLPEDAELLSLLCAHAAVAVENARIHRALLRKQQIESDLAFATSIQRSFLPPGVPQLEGYRFHALYRSALEVGGDFYDFIPLEGQRLGILVGDVSGKGIASALTMAKLTSDFRLLAIRQKEPARLVEEINHLFCLRSRRGMFVTLVYLVLDPGNGEVDFINAGHVPPVLWNAARDRFELLKKPGGPPVGIVPGQVYSPGKLHLEPRDCLLLSTDGLIEAKNPQGDRLGWERLESAVRRGDSRVETVYARTMESLGQFVEDCPQADDITLVLVGVEES